MYIFRLPIRCKDTVVHTKNVGIAGSAGCKFTAENPCKADPACAV